MNKNTQLKQKILLNRTSKAKKRLWTMKETYSWNSQHKTCIGTSPQSSISFLQKFYLITRNKLTTNWKLISYQEKNKEGMTISGEIVWVDLRHSPHLLDHLVDHIKCSPVPGTIGRTTWTISSAIYIRRVTTDIRANLQSSNCHYIRISSPHKTQEENAAWFMHHCLTHWPFSE